jgi:hypothetical protein
VGFSKGSYLVLKLIQHIKAKLVVLRRLIKESLILGLILLTDPVICLQILLEYFREFA